MTSDEHGPRVPVRCGTMLLGLSPEESDEIGQIWRDAERRRAAWLRSRNPPTEDQILEADIIEAGHRVEDAANTYGMASPQLSDALSEQWRLIQIRNNRSKKGEH